MKNVEIKSIYLDNETVGLTVIYYKKVNDVWEPHAIAEQLYICKDGSSRRALPTDYDSGSYWGFIAEDGKDDFVEVQNASCEEDDFDEIMNEAFELLDKNGILDEDGCIPADAPYKLYESEKTK